jgi:hypothetical protein
MAKTNSNGFEYLSKTIPNISIAKLKRRYPRETSNPTNPGSINLCRKSDTQKEQPSRNF